MALAVVAIPLVLSLAYAVCLSNAGGGEGVPGAVAVPATLTDPLQRSVWTDGVKSVQTALNDPKFDAFADSFVHVSDSRLVAFCGTLPGVGAGAQRFVSVFGQRYSTVLEGHDGSFDVLWNRVCSAAAKQA